VGYVGSGRLGCSVEGFGCRSGWGRCIYGCRCEMKSRKRQGVGGDSARQWDGIAMG